MNSQTDLLALRRRQAKLGMSAALGTLVATGLMTGKGNSWSKAASTLHLCAGIAMVGFSYWHWTLYHTKQNTPPLFPEGHS